MTKPNHACPCCGYYTLEERFNREICMICFWEDDVEVIHGEDSFSEANKLFVSDAQINFLETGIVDPAYASKNREPLPTDLRCSNWKPIQEAQRRLALSALSEKAPVARELSLGASTD